jgi:hypothetical protein
LLPQKSECGSAGLNVTAKERQVLAAQKSECGSAGLNITAKVRAMQDRTMVILLFLFLSRSFLLVSRARLEFSSRYFRICTIRQNKKTGFNKRQSKDIQTNFDQPNHLGQSFD